MGKALEKIEMNDKPKSVGSDQRRTTTRKEFYKGEFPLATVIFADKSYSGDVFDISPSGIGVLPHQSIEGLTDVPQRISISIDNGSSQEAVVKSISHIKFSGSMRIKLGIELSVDDEAISLDKRFQCISCKPLAYCKDPVSFGRTLLFNVEYYTNKGLGLSVAFENSSFFTGMNLDLQVMRKS